MNYQNPTGVLLGQEALENKIIILIMLLNPDSLFILADNAGTFVSGNCKFIPSADLTIKIEDNSWVNDSIIIERR